MVTLKVNIRRVTECAMKSTSVYYNKKFSYAMGRRRLLELYGGLCSMCGDWPDYKVMYNVGDEYQGAWLVERYDENVIPHGRIEAVSAS